MTEMMPRPWSGMPGVEYRPPPADVMPTIMASIDKAMANLREGERGAVVALLDSKGVNGAIVVKVSPEDAPVQVQIVSFMGKEWGKPVEGGAAIVARW